VLPTTIIKFCWKKFLPNPQATTVVNPGEDLGYDIYAAEPELLLPGRVVRVRMELQLNLILHLELSYGSGPPWL